jgi:hypothetical protein
VPASQFTAEICCAGRQKKGLLRNKSKNDPYLHLQRLLTAWSSTFWEVSRLLDGQAVNSLSCGVYCQDLTISRMKTQQQQSNDKKYNKKRGTGNRIFGSDGALW